MYKKYLDIPTGGLAFPKKCNQKMRLTELSGELQNDTEMYKLVSEISHRWYGLSLNQISLIQKAMLIPYVRRKMKTTPSQLARVFGLDKERIREILGAKK